ncbi:MAG: hydroxymethylbilane synthase [Opitutales bacterium]
MTETAPHITLATRKSPLALKQAELAAEALKGSMGAEVELLPLSTTGDRQLEWSLEQEGGKGLFTKELETALLEGRADLAVHSAKDMPTDMPTGLALAGYLPREDPRDMLVFREEIDIPRVIATGSPRRRSQLSERFPEVEWKEIRGNVGTRLRKIAEEHEADATVLAAAGLKRLGIDSFPGLGFKPFSVDEMVPAPGQAAIALQVREEDVERFRVACDPATFEQVDLERSLLEALGGGCQVAIGAHLRGDEFFVFHGDKGRCSVNVSGLSVAEAVELALNALNEA